MGDPVPGSRHPENGPPAPAPPLEPGMLTWWRGSRGWYVRCAHCSTYLAYGRDLPDTLEHARRDATATPCCPEWSTTGTTTTNPTTGGNA